MYILYMINRPFHNNCGPAFIRNICEIVSGNNTISRKNDLVEQLNAFMMSRFYCEIVTFPLTNVPEKCWTAVIMNDERVYRAKCSMAS